METTGCYYSLWSTDASYIHSGFDRCYLLRERADRIRIRRHLNIPRTRHPIVGASPPAQFLFPGAGRLQPPRLKSPTLLQPLRYHSPLFPLMPSPPPPSCSTFAPFYPSSFAPILRLAVPPFFEEAPLCYLSEIFFPFASFFSWLVRCPGGHLLNIPRRALFGLLEG